MPMCENYIFHLKHWDCELRLPLFWMLIVLIQEISLKNLAGVGKSLESLSNLKVVLKNEGFDEIKLQYMGELWVLLEFPSSKIKELFQENRGVGSCYLRGKVFVLRAQRNPWRFTEIADELDDDVNLEEGGSSYFDIRGPTRLLHAHGRGGIEQSQFKKLTDLLIPIVLNPCPDRWFWSLEGSGEFSVASIRRFIDDQRLLTVDSKTLWIKSVPIKVNILAWKIKLEALPTRFNISRRGIEIDSILCPICDRGVESTRHIFFSCCLVRQIARKICSWWDIEYSDVNSFTEWINWMASLRLQSKVKMMIQGVFFVVWWLVWSYRNKLLFEEKKPSKAIIFDDVVSISFYWFAAAMVVEEGEEEGLAFTRKLHAKRKSLWKTYDRPNIVTGSNLQNSLQSKIDQTSKISKSVFISNFPDDCSSRDLWKVCNGYGTVVDVFIPNKRSKAGKRFAFVRFINVLNLDRLIENLKTIWIGRFHLSANLAQFERPKASTFQKEKPVLSGNVTGFKQSIVQNQGGPKESYSSILKPSLVLDDSCLVNRDLTNCVMGEVLQFSSINNLQVLLSNEGFHNTRVVYLGGLWVMIELKSSKSKLKFMEHGLRVLRGIRVFVMRNQISQLKNG
ncbi:RNA-directed DNA polymerase, eukaryota [Tanacetum coccineum]